MLILSLLITSNAKAQQPKAMVQQSTDNSPASPMSQQLMKVITVGDYSYRILPAPNNSFGYDIFQNKRLLFHQPVLTFIANDGVRVFPGREQAEKIVLMTIAKMKKGKLPILTNEEMKKIAQ